MDFEGPEPADYHNVRSLNQEFLLRLRDSASGRSWRQLLAAPLRPTVRSLTDLQAERLAEAPFLLFSVREDDADYWSLLGSNAVQADLLARRRRGPGASQLAAASLGFLWQLARRNPYAVRLVSGASLSWCESLAECTLLHLLRFSSIREDMLQPRRGADVEFWNKLLGPGVSAEAPVQSAAQLSALQSILTRDTAARYPALRAAACSATQPARSIADKDPP